MEHHGAVQLKPNSRDPVCARTYQAILVQLLRRSLAPELASALTFCKMRHLLDCSSAELTIGLAVFSFLVVAYIGLECTTASGPPCPVQRNSVAETPSSASTRRSPCFFSMVLGSASFSVLLLACSRLARPLYRRRPIDKKKSRRNRGVCRDLCTVGPATCLLVVAVCAAVLPVYPATSFAPSRQIISVITVTHLFALSAFTGVPSRFLLILSCSVVVRDFVVAIHATFPPVVQLTNACYVGIVAFYCVVLRLRLRRFAVFFLLAEQFPYRLSCVFLPGVLPMEIFNVRQMHLRGKRSWRVAEGTTAQGQLGRDGSPVERDLARGPEAYNDACIALAAVRAQAKTASKA